MAIAPENVVKDKKTGRFVKKSVFTWKDNVVRSIYARCHSDASPVDRQSSGNVTSTMRLVVELQQLAIDLWCLKCDMPLSLRWMDPKSCSQRGLAFTFNVRCKQCQVIWLVHTAKKHASENKYSTTFDVNYKLAMGCIDTALGGDQVNSFVTALNIPVVSKSLLKRHDRSVGKAVEEVAKDSCAEAISLEKSLTIEQQQTSVDMEQSIDEDDPSGNGLLHSDKELVTSTPMNVPGIGHPKRQILGCLNDNSVAFTPKRRKELAGKENTVPPPHSPPKKVCLTGSIDAGWQKRGTGRSYNSLSGHATLIGHLSGKVLDFGTKSKSCSLCNRGHDPSDHDCRKNHVGSARAMEPALAVELCTNNPLLDAANVVIGTLVGDGDSTAIQAVRRESSVPVTKWLILNHVRKGFSNAIFSNNLPDNVRTYLCTSFGYAICQNKGHPAAVKAAILNIVKHAYGEHEECGSWCKFSDDPTNYKHRGLPGGKPLSSIELRASLTKILTRYADNCDKIAPCASSQANESFNNLVATKNPKYKFNAGSESLAFRVAAAVGQKNVGTKYVVKVNKKVGLSPGKVTSQYREMRDKYRNIRSQHQKTKEYKTRRMLWKRRRSGRAMAEERSEGVTYSTGCELAGIADLVDHPEVMNHDLCAKDATPVFVDLETTGRSKVTCEVLQLAAKAGDREYSVYIVPQKGIPASATAVNGLTSEGGELYLNGKKVVTTPPRIAFSGFIEFLKGLKQNVVLLAHNGMRFDHPIILRDIRKYNLLQDFLEVVAGFIDTIEVFRDKLPQRVREKLSFSQPQLAADYGINNPDAHNAIGDVTVLQQITVKIGVGHADLLRHVKTVACVVRKEDHLATKAIKAVDLQCLKPTVSASMISKIAAAGISLHKLQTVYRSGGEAALAYLLNHDVDGKPNVTKMKAKVSEIVAAVQATLDNDEAVQAVL